MSINYSESFRRRLLSVLRCGMDMEELTLVLSEEECKELKLFAERQSILPIIHRGLRKSTIPQSSANDIRTSVLKDTYHMIQHREALKIIKAALTDDKIPHIPLKGSVISALYPNPDLRTSCDIDILIKESDLDQAVRTIESNTEFRSVERNYHDISMISRRVHLELHYNIKENSEKMDRILIQAWDYAIQTNDKYCYAFVPEFQIFHIIAHMCHHFENGGLGIRPFIDLWLLKNRTDYDEKKIQNMCEQCGLLKFYDECCRLTRNWFDFEPYTETTRLLESFCFAGGVFGTESFAFASKQRKRRGVSYIVSRIFPPPYEVKEYYPDFSGKEHHVAYYYFKRWFKWAGKNRRKEVKKRVLGVMTSEKDYLDLTKKLFDKLEL